MENKLGLRLENLCEQFNYDYKTISKKLGYSENTFGHYVRGVRTPDYHTLIKIADLFNVSLDYLLRGKEFSYNRKDHLNDLLPILDRIGAQKASIHLSEHWDSLTDDNLKEVVSHFEWVLDRQNYLKK
ncbi:helix-turn-helix domain-containing protein [Gracilibacillus orientalis]|uniref:helix-turn-helix domain-containing protein n=1 Tax=Gracilibacillus orientalis TaxID=334253 RepID=UPI001FE6ADA7|nr:helix-turn-helix transcriptional regulator [Gracilibacillus orientalis]